MFLIMSWDMFISLPSCFTGCHLSTPVVKLSLQSMLKTSVGDISLVSVSCYMVAGKSFAFPEVCPGARLKRKSNSALAQGQMTVYGEQEGGRNRESP